jgi:hypothetical protein
MCAERLDVTQDLLGFTMMMPFVMRRIEFDLVKVGLCRLGCFSHKHPSLSCSFFALSINVIC